MGQPENKFATYSDTKLKEWIRVYELCPSTHLIISETEYQEAIQEKGRRIKQILRESK